MSSPTGTRFRDGGLVVVLALALGPALARAADIETRDFSVTVAGKPAGEVHMTIQKEADGRVAMRCDTDIKVDRLVGNYKFIYRGHEVWKDNRLVRFDSGTDDNGKRYNVSAVAEADGVKLKVNNVERKVRADVWLTSYWCLPDPKLRNGTVPLIDADNGKELDSKLQYVATEKLRVAGQEVSLNHYRLTGKVTVDLWFDGSERLVRQEFVEQGHKTVVELVRVRR